MDFSKIMLDYFQDNNMMHFFPNKANIFCFKIHIFAVHQFCFLII